MKNALMKFAGLFVERVPVDQQPPPPRAAQGAAPTTPTPAAHHPAALHPTAAAPAGAVPLHGQQPTGDVGGAAAAQLQPVAVALRAWVPQEYAAHLAPFGVHVIAAGGSVTSEQARGWGASVLVVSAECLGQDVHLLQQPQLPTVFISPQPVMLPDVAGVVQVQEPIRASEVARAVRDAHSAFAPPRPG